MTGHNPSLEQHETTIDKRMALSLALRDAGYEAPERVVDVAIRSLEANRWHLLFVENQPLQSIPDGAEEPIPSVDMVSEGRVEGIGASVNDGAGNELDSGDEGTGGRA